MRIQISSDTAIDMTKELLTEYDIKAVPFQLFLGDTNYLDGEITPDEIIDFVSKNKILPKTGAVNEFQFEEYFTGYEGVC